VDAARATQQSAARIDMFVVTPHSCHGAIMERW
jgi:hypothetical protein